MAPSRNRKRRRAPQTPVEEAANPQRGGKAYSQDMRRHCIAQRDSGDFNLSETLPCPKTLRRWVDRRDDEGTILPYEPSGNSPSQVIAGYERLLLALYRLGYPEATADEVIAFLHEYGNTHRVYSRTDISRAEDDLGLSRKAASTTANEAFSPANLQRREVFWTSPPPAGVFGSNFNSLVDYDEFALDIVKGERNHGKAYLDIRVRKRGNYTRDTKYTVLICVTATGERWITIRQVAGTDSVTVADFFNSLVLPGLNAIQPPRTFNIMMDNLNSHHSPLVTNAIYFSGHQPLFRPPYRPQDAPIEFVINSIDLEVQGTSSSLL